MILCNLYHGGRAKLYDLGEQGRVQAFGIGTKPFVLPDAANEPRFDPLVVARIERGPEPA